MTVVTCQVADTVADPVAVSFKWRVVLPTDVTPALLADFGSVLPSGSGQIAADASPRVAGININTVPNTAYQGDRFFDVEIYDVVPATSILTTSKTRIRIQEDDAAPGAIGPLNLAAGETRVFEIGSRTQSVRFKSPDYPFVFVDLLYDGDKTANTLAIFANTAKTQAFRGGNKPVASNSQTTNESAMRGSEVRIKGNTDGTEMIGYGVTFTSTFGGFPAESTKLRVRAVKAITDLYVTAGNFT